MALRQVPAVTLGSLFLQAPISDMPRFVLFFISYGLQLLLFLVSGFSDIAPETKEIKKKVRDPCRSGLGAQGTTSWLVSHGAGWAPYILLLAPVGGKT